MKVCVASVTLVLLTLALGTDAWWWRRKPPACAQKREGSKPYYFGTTNLLCMAVHKKRSDTPSRSTISIAHRFIYYDGFYFEFGIGSSHAAVYGRTATESDVCSSSRESSPAGYSTLSVDCIKRCTEKYKSKYGGYNLLFHNCHHFANRMSEILCNHSSCPTWC